MVENNAFVSDEKNDGASAQSKISKAHGNSYDVNNSHADTRSNVISNDSKDDECGILCCKPSWAQTFIHTKWFLVVISLIAFVQGFVVNGVNNVNTASYERRFHLTAQQAGSVSSAYDFSVGVLALPISYYGSFANKPRMIGFATIALGVGSFCMALPHFVTGPYEAGEQVNKLCNATESSCKQSHLSDFLYLLNFGQILHGFNGVILYSVGVAAIDDNVNNHMSPLYLGIFFAFASLGPAVGFLCSGVFLNYYVDFDRVTDVDLTKDDPRWVGAWWLGFVISFIFSMIIAGLFFLFPRESPEAEQLRADRAKTNPDGQVQQHKLLMKAFKEIPSTTWRLLKDPTLVFTSLAGATEAILVGGLGAFLPKIIKNQFNQTDSMAAILTGAMAVPGIAGGQFFGGYIMKRTQWGVKGMLRFNTVMALCTILISGIFFARCDQNKIAGINIPYDLNTESRLNMTSSCNKDCGCNVEYYDPMCIDNIEYFTPCYAGCRDQDFVDGKKNYYNCSCVSSHLTLLNTTRTHGVAGKCGTSCLYLYVFLFFCFLLMFFTFLASIPASSAILRCVADKDKTYALGVESVLGRLIGSVPGPLIFGAIIDSVCVLWQKICGVKKSCWIYDNGAMGRNLFLIVVVTKCITTLFFLLAGCLYKPSLHDAVHNYDLDIQTTDADRADVSGHVNETSENENI